MPGPSHKRSTPITPLAFLRDEAHLPPAHRPTEAAASPTHLFPKALVSGRAGQASAGRSAGPGVQDSISIAEIQIERN